MRNTKVAAACIFNKLQAAGMFLALDGTSTHTDPSTSGRKYRKLVNNAVFICNESLFVVSAIKAHVTFNLDPSKLVPPGTNFSEIFGPILKNLFPLQASHTKENQ